MPEVFPLVVESHSTVEFSVGVRNSFVSVDHSSFGYTSPSLAVQHPSAEAWRHSLVLGSPILFLLLSGLQSSLPTITTMIVIKIAQNNIQFDTVLVLKLFNLNIL